jgi:hypothetical protein
MTIFTSALARLTRDVAAAHPNPAMMKADPPSRGRIVATGLVAEAGADPESTMSGEAFLEKALAAVGRGHISTAQLHEAEQYINQGKVPPRPIVKAVLLEQKYWPF